MSQLVTLLRQVLIQYGILMSLVVLVSPLCMLRFIMRVQGLGHVLDGYS